MSLQSRIRQEAKLDSRRFGKSITCRIVHGPLLGFMQKNGMVPSGITMLESTGLDPRTLKIFVIPVVAYQNVLDMLLNFEQDSKELDIDSIASLTSGKDNLVNVLRQNVILVTMNGSKPHSKDAGGLPELYDVLIDSIDVNQSIEGTYVLRTKQNVEKDERWDERK